MKTTKYIGIAALLLFLSLKSISMLSQNNMGTREVTAPHGGKIKAAKDYFIELIFSSEKTYVYLLDKRTKPINNAGIKGRVIFQSFDSTLTTAELIPYQTDGFITKTSVPAYTVCTIYFEFGGKTISAVFDNSDTIADKKPAKQKAN